MIYLPATSAVTVSLFVPHQGTDDNIHTWTALAEQSHKGLF